MKSYSQPSQPLRNIRLLIEYDGTPYAGWQIQAHPHGHAPTVQGTLQQALRDLTHEPAVYLTGAGRTDAGVHAYAQVGNFLTRSPLEARRFAPALNAYLPASLRIHRSEEVFLDFDARKHATAKIYRYRIYQGPHPLALDRLRAWHVRHSLDIEAMRMAAACCVGTRNFEAFRSTHCDAPHALRTMHSLHIQVTARPPLGHWIDLIFYANAFCRHMCRILAGTLMEVGAGRRSLSQVQAALLSQRRQDAGVTAPAWGLTLVEVVFEGAGSRMPQNEANPQIEPLFSLP